MYTSLLPYMRCSRCAAVSLRSEKDGVVCLSCATLFPVRGGILDTLVDASEEVITPFQRLMQSRGVVSIYERMWRQAGYYVASSRPFSSELDTVLRFQGKADSKRVLDLACGTGVFTRPIARQTGGIVVGLDLSWPMLRQAQRLVERGGLGNVLLVRGTAFALPFVDRAFDCVNCCGALHLFDRPDAALREIDRVLAGAGHLTVQTTIRPDHSAGMAYFLERFIRFGFFSLPELQEMICQHRFKILESERHRISYTFRALHLS